MIGYPECVQLLLTASVAVDQPNQFGNTALIMACCYGCSECIELLHAANAAVDQRNNVGDTPLMLACYEGHPECVRLLLAASAAVDQLNQFGSTPLIYSSDQGHTECVRLLPAASAAVNLVTKDGDSTALVLACAWGHLGIVRQLLHAGARKELRSPDGTPLLQLAEQHGHTAIAKLLRAHRRRVPPSASTALPSESERAAAERAAELAAEALLAEEEEQAKPKAQGKRAKAKAKSAGTGAAGPTCTDGALVGGATAVAISAEESTPDATRSAADEALRVAVAAEEYENLARALEAHSTLASDAA
eukprot:7380201-Prymnesium_polylepis.2